VCAWVAWTGRQRHAIHQLRGPPQSEAVDRNAFLHSPLRGAGARRLVAAVEADLVPRLRGGAVAQQVFGLERTHVDVVERHRLGGCEVEAETYLVPGRQLGQETMGGNRADELLDGARDDDASGVEKTIARVVESLADVLLARIVAERFGHD